MDVNPDFNDLLKILNDYSVRYLIVGGYAVMYYAESRFTKDIDICIEPTRVNDRKVVMAQLFGERCTIFKSFQRF